MMLLRVGALGLGVYCYLQAIWQAVDYDLGMAVFYAGLYAAFVYLALDALERVRL